MRCSSASRGFSKSGYVLNPEPLADYEIEIIRLLLEKPMSYQEMQKRGLRHLEIARLYRSIKHIENAGVLIYEEGGGSGRNAVYGIMDTAGDRAVEIIKTGGKSK